MKRKIEILSPAGSYESMKAQLRQEQMQSILAAVDLVQEHMLTT